MTLNKQERRAYTTLVTPETGLKIDSSRINYIQVIGSGSFGTVWKATIGSNLVAVKKMKTENLSTSERDALKSEAEIMQQLSHPRIVYCLGVFESADIYCMVLEFCPGGSLANLIEDSPRISNLQMTDMVLDILVGMAYLHKVNIVHRDLKPGNIVLDDCKRAKIVDFGLAVTKSSTMTSFRGAGEAGTPAFMVFLNVIDNNSGP